MTVRRNVKKSAFRRPSRRLAHQTLEKRQLLAADLGEAAPRLVAVAANSGENFELDDNNVLSVAPSELTFRFDGGQELDSSTLSAIRFIPSGGDGSFDAEDTPITPGYVGFADDGGSRIVVARFAETLPDDIYKIEIAGFDDTNAGIVGLRNTDGVLFQPNDPLDTLRPMEEIRFEVEVGPRVTAVVPQPIEGVGASRVQHRDQIHVYFNEDPLSNPAGGPVNSATSGLPVVNPQFYKLIFTSDTVENTDDSVTLPTSVEYDPLLNRAVLTFSDDLSELTDAAANNGSATYRLRIGSGEPLPAAPTPVDGSADAGDLFSGATSLGVNFGTGTGSVVVSDAAIIQANDIMPSWPAAGDTVGSRDTRRDPEIVGRIDTNTGIDVFEYNFADLYGLNPQGQQRNNAITEAQKQRIREVLDLYSERMGVQFIETEDSGLQIVTGDLRAIIINAETGSGPDTSYSLFRVNEADPSRGVLVFDGAESWFDDYGLSPDARPSFFVEAVRGVGNLLGIGHLFHLPEGVGAGGSSPDEVRSTTFSDFYPNLPVEPEFLSQSDVSLGQALHRPESNDVDFYSFSANVDGEVRIETFAQRLDGSSLLDTHLQLYRVDPATGAYELVAQNGDFFSNDSYIALDVEAGDYIVGVSAAGNENYNGEVANSGLGGLSEGRYELRVTFQGQGGTTITDTTGTELDGDADGVAGGDFNFWFQTARDTASPAADEARVIYVDKLGRDTNNGTLGAPLQTISAAFDAARPGDIVRLLPNGGADNLIQTVDDNVTYEIGRGGTNNSVLRDGSEFEVPQGVTVMIDAGAILKLQSAKISVGSESVDEDRSLASLQILGTPLPTDDDGQPLLDAAGSVFFTAYNDESIGVDTNPLPTSPQPGNWAGIEFRNDFDYSEGRPVWENEGIFLDYASHADMKYGGGSVSASRPVVNTFTMLESRPTLIYNTIQFAADAAMSADPDSFLETNFHGPIFQRVDRFTSDYDRVGPELSGNLLLDNTFNGLNIRIDTPAGGQTEPMTVSGRLDDTDIVHLLSQSLLIQGQPGGPQLLENRPDVLNVTLTQTTGGTLVDGTAYDYRVTYVTADGTESLASLPTVMAVADAGGAIEIRNLPTAPSSFAGRRLYRLNPGTMEYEFVASLDRGTTSFLDTGETRGGVLPGNGMNDTTLLPRFDARLAVDPGIVVKMLGARIEATFGADFIAEGVDGREVIFTSRADDTYGAGGTFDSNNDGSMLTPQPGDWSGLVFRQDASASLDYAQVAYGGGLSLVAGDVVDFNPIEILQADVRIAHSTIRDNADGFTTSSTRNGRGFNDESTIFVRGSQPIIVSNTIIDNEGAAISINPDALDYTDRLDHGRSTGPVDIVDSDHDNQGPLIDGNRLADNGLNGLLVRSEILTTESVWDDTDIVHIVNGEIVSMTHHIRSGLRLKSDANQSLVVKFGPNGTLVGSGRPLDITDRVGGTLQVLGQGGFPVIMTSLADDTVGAGFTPAGIAQTDTDNAAATPAPGDWIGLQLESYVNDRNVAFITESERAIDAAINDNAAANDAQVVGLLARDEKSGDETARLGFNIRGALANPDDQDVYRFDAAGGTEVFIDIDDTTFGLDTVVELIDVNNRVLASSDNSFEEISDPSQLFSILPESAVEPLYRSGTGQTESPNILDAGFRVVLDGSASTTNSYYVRVRTADGKSSGQYQLSIRLREADEIAGSTIQLADIRYATDAITVSGAPLHSPLAGDASESLVYTGGGRGYDANATVLNWSPAIADQLGNLMTSDRGSLVVNGEIGNSQNVTAAARVNDLDVYQVDLFNQQLEPDVFNSEQRFVQATFDIDYADGLGRLNTSLAVYDSTGRLILHSRDSNVADDQGQPTAGVDTDNLTAGSAGTADAYIGPVELPEGTYYVVVSNASAVPEALGQFFDPDSAHTDVRLQPINSLRRIADDNLDGTLGWTADEPVVPLFNTGGIGDSPIVEYSLEDVRLFVGLESNIGGGQEDSTLVSFNPFTGTLDRLIGDWDQAHGDIAMRRDGTLYTYTTDPPEGSNYQSGNIGNYLRISTTDASETNIGDDSLTFYRTNQGGNGVEVDTGQNSDDSTFIVEAMAFRANDNGLGNGSINNTAAINQNDRFVAIGNRRIARDPTIPVGATENILYLMQTTSGQATRRGSLNGQDIQYGQSPYNIRYGAAENRPEMGIVDTGNYLGNNGDGGIITGVDYLPDGPSTEMVAVTDNGGVHVFDYTVNQPALFGDLVGYNEVIPTEYYGQLEPHPEHGVTTLTFSGLEFGPRGVANGELRNVLFATTADGWLYAFELDAVTQSLVPSYVFYNGRSAVPLVTTTGIASPTTTGLAFSTLEAAPWHTTTDRRNDGGHGFSDAPYDNSRLQVNNAGNSFYYGFEIDNNQANNTLERPEGDPLGQLAPGGSHGTIISNAFSLEGYSSNDKPTVYFNYFLEVEADDDYVPNSRNQNDALRVFASGDDGVWHLLATNDNYRSASGVDEYDYFATSGIPVQEIFDDSGTWRQARIDISPLAGNENVRLRFDFSTDGTMRAHAGSVELVAVPGDEIPDNSTVVATTQTGIGTETVVLENIVGQDIIVPDGSQLTDGDQFIVQSPTGNVTATFREGPLATDPLPGEIVFLPTSTADEVAQAVVAGLPKLLRPYNDGGGRVSLLAATNVVPVGNAPIGLNTTVKLTQTQTTIIPPEGSVLPSGETVIVTAGGTSTTMRFVFAADAVGDPEEIIFDNTFTSDQIAAAIYGRLPIEAGAYLIGNQIAFTQPANVTVQPAPTKIQWLDPINTVEDRLTIQIPADPAGDINNAEVITITGPSGTQYTINFIDNDFGFPGQVSKQNADPDVVAERLWNEINRLDVTGELGAVLDGDTVSFFFGVDIQSEDSAFAYDVLVDPTSIQLPADPSTGIDDAEVLTITGPTGTDYQITFDADDDPSNDAPGVVSKGNTDPAVVAQRLLDAINDLDIDGELDAVLVGDTVFLRSSVVVQMGGSGFVLTPQSDLLSIQVPADPSADINDAEVLTLTGPSGAQYQITFDPDDDPSNDAAGVVSKDNPDPLVVAQRLFDAITAVDANGELTPVLIGDTVFLQFGGVVQTEDSSLVYDAVVDVSSRLQLNLTDGINLRSGEQLAVSDDNDFLTITFVEQGQISPTPFNVVYYDDTQVASDLFGDVVQLLRNADINAYVSPDGLGVNVLADSVPLGFFPDPPEAFIVSDPVFTQTTTTDVDTSVVPITLPGGDRLVDGETITLVAKNDPTAANAQTITFVLDDGMTVAGPNEVLFLPTDTGADIAEALWEVIDPQFQAVQSTGNVLYLIYGRSASVQAGSAIVSFSPSVPGAIAVQLDSTMNSFAVADQLRISIAEGFGAVTADDGISKATIDQYALVGGDRIRIFQTSFSSVGPYGLSTALPGDEFGETVSTSFTATNQIRSQGAANNEVEGVYIDDIIIGFAERGEMVLDAPTNVFDFINNPETTRGSTQPERPNEILVGEYSLEIRASDEFGVPTDAAVALGLTTPAGTGRSFDTNDRLTEGAVTLFTQAGQYLQDGDTFVLYDGTNSLTFEFDDVLQPGIADGNVRVVFDASEDEPQYIAVAIRNAINSPQVQEVLDIVAATYDSDDSNNVPGESITTGNRVELFGEDIQVNPGGGRFIRMDLVAEETYQGRATSRTMPMVDHDTQTVTYVTVGDSLARSAVSGYVDGDTDVLVATGKIGDRVDEAINATAFGGLPTSDTDSVRIYLSMNQVIDIDLDTFGYTKDNSFFSAELSVFDGDETLLASANSGFAPGESQQGVFLTFTAPADGYYDIQVASVDVVGGEYALTVRPHAATNDLIPDRDVLIVDYQTGQTDENRERDQGQILISGNFISHSANYGISATAGDRGQAQVAGGAADDLARPGSAALRRNVNPESQIPGAVLTNNVVYDSGVGGILFAGGTQNAGQSPAPVSYGRIVNNTVVGNGSGSGITVESSAAPTLLNNVVTNFATGIDVDASSENAGTVIGANAFQDNGTNATVPLSAQSIVIPSGTPVFADPAREIYIPAMGSQIIDSSVAELADRSDLFLTVKEPSGISPSPIIAPGFDAYGQPRIDDPTVSSPGGVGGNVFIDRGAIDRSDSTRPIAVLTTPQDAIGSIVPDGDGDPDESFVRLAMGTVEFFELQLLDENGTGPDGATITEESVLLTENGRRLIPGVDFTFGYSDNSRTIRLTPLAGLWNPDAVYEITLNNSERIAYDAPAGNQITDGDQLVITDASGNESVFEFESGYVLNIPTPKSVSVGAPADFQDGDFFTISAPDGTSQRFEFNKAGAVQTGNVEIDISTAGTVVGVRDAILAALSDPAIITMLDIAPVAVGQSDIQLGFTSNHAISGTVAGLTIFGSDQAVEDGDIFSYTGNGNTVNFELTFDDDPVAGTNVAVRLERTDTPDEMAAKIAAVVAAQPLGLDGAQAIGDGSILLGGTAQDSLSIGNIAIQTIGMAGVTGSLMITVPSGTTGSAVNGQTFTVTNGTLSETFQLNTDPNATSANRLVTFDAAATANEIAAVIASEIGIAFTGTLSPTANGNVIALGEQAAIPPAGQSQVSASVDVGTSALVVDGVSGGAIPVRFLPTADFSPLAVAATLVEAVRLSPLDSETFSPGGGTILFSQTESIIGIGSDGQPVDVASIVPAVSDLAGNPVAPNRDNQETRFTIIMPEVKFDFGDAPQSGGLSYPTMLDVNGARHALTNTTSVILGSLIDSEPDGQPSPGADDDRLPVAVTQSDSLFAITDLGDGTTEMELVQAPAGRETLTVNIDGTVFTLEFIRVVDNPTGNNLPVVFADGESLSSIATKTFTVIRGQLDSFGGSVVGSIGDPDDAIFSLTAIDDEDGVSTGTFTALNGDVLTVFATPGSSGTLTADEVVGFLNKADSAGTPIAITVTGTGLLDGWIDFNADGDFNDDGEQIFRSEPVTTGVNSLTVQVPMTAIEGETWMRLRVSDSGNLGPDGVSVGGEVEDYEVSVRSIAPAMPVDDSYLGMLDEDNTLEITDQASGLLINDTNLDTQLLPVGAFIVDQPANGVVEMIDPFAGTFRYTPNQDFNGTDTFTYRLGTQEMVGDAVLAASPTATVTIDVQPVNDDPVFDAQTMLELLERDVADDTITIPGVITNAAAGPPTAEDELANQTVTLSIVGVTETPGLMQTATQITQDGDLIVDPAPNAYGTAEYVIQVSDGIVDLTTTVTVVVQPVNDPPQIDPSVAGQSDMAGPDDQYSVSAVDGSITYTLSEDNSADPNSDSFFIPLQQDGSAAGYARIGLMDVFVAGPPNELANLPGGNQILELDRIDLTTARGGTLTPVADGGQIIGFNYVPPVDLNSDVVQFDQFTYDVIDDNPNGGETYSLDQGMLVEDRLTASNTVLLVLNPVNDAPQFNLPQGLVQVEEDSTRRVFNNFATGIAAASPVTAFDEIDAISGQNVFFELTPLDFNTADMADFFSEAPMISAGGDLVFQPAADVFGSFDFDVVLFDDGADDPSRGDINRSAAMTLTIEILPINDPPKLVDPNQPLSYMVDEDGSIEIPVGGDGITMGMLDQFVVGPANEAADIAPEVGGNQTLALARPYPIATAAGGTLTPVLDGSNEVVALRYTPRENFTGADSFIYTVTDDGQTAVAGGPVVDDPRIAAGNVLLTVNPINDPPQFSLGDDIVVDEDAGTVTVSDWATNVQAGPTSASDEVNGTATVDPQVVSFMITQVSTTNENLFNGSVTATVNGTNGELVFTPADDQSGTATFEVKLTDDGGTDNGGIDTSEVRTFTITVNPVNDPPTYTPGTDVTVDEDSGAYNEPWATDISPGPADESSQTVSFVVETPTQSQSLFASLPQISPDGTLQFTPADDAAGVVDLTVRAIDSDGAEAASTTLTITITPVNDVPIAVADELDHNEDSILTIPSSVLLANDIDVDPTDTLTVVLPESSFTSNGAQLTYNSTTGDITYDPTDASLLQQLAEGQTLFDTFTYQVIDSAGATSQPVTVTIDVEGRNDAPVLVPDNPSLNQDGPTVITPLVNDFDIDGAIDPSSIEITSQPSFGSLEVRPNGTIIYTPFAGTSGTDSFTYTVADESGLRSQPATITLGLNVAPIANNDRAVTYWNETINIDLIDNDVDNDGLIDPESLSIVTSPAFGQVSVNTDGTVDYIPADGFVGNDSFQYTVSDEAGFVSNTALVSVQVIASRLQNQTEFNDVNDDGFITAIDALLIINELERAGGGPIAVEPDDVPPPYYDVSGDRFITAFDSLLVINHLNRTGGGSVAGEGESSASVAPLRVDSAQSVTAPVGDVVAATTETVTDRVVGSAQYDVVEDSVLGLIAVASDDDDEDSVDAIDAALADLL
ncbi:tandem-95 repeat protein [Crateriforma conspicua]|uniref:Dockerin type I repeat protein n=1 Tax=Crateriforma conspicua TaxID=2527996 RepID=A0A5C6FW92_9PLAN|nr:tandem-95 repeat protein [Crateriforma conspicua]TWU66701.1 hypothetical protein V7x_22720 [Crateriforma conspicua]